MGLLGNERRIELLNSALTCGGQRRCWVGNISAFINQYRMIRRSVRQITKNSSTMRASKLSILYRISFYVEPAQLRLLVSLNCPSGWIHFLLSCLEYCQKILHLHSVTAKMSNTYNYNQASAGFHSQARWRYQVLTTPRYSSFIRRSSISFVY